ncbi:MAG: hypothetical protein IPK83_20275 [Planctomycetes bacterium]|nr:hypothetical protein [Planctomycetota bacterium]
MPGYVRVAKTDENSTDSLLAERGKTHGDYHEQAELAGALRDLFATAGKWNKLTRVEKDAVLMIAVKLSRALTGNPHEGDHWKDIQGYARLVEKDLEFYGSPKAQPE